MADKNNNKNNAIIYLLNPNGPIPELQIIRSTAEQKWIDSTKAWELNERIVYRFIPLINSFICSERGLLDSLSPCWRSFNESSFSYDSSTAFSNLLRHLTSFWALDIFNAQLPQHLLPVQLIVSRIILLSLCCSLKSILPQPSLTFSISQSHIAQLLKSLSAITTKHQGEVNHFTFDFVLYIIP